MNNQTTYTNEELQALYDYFAVSVASEMLLALGFILIIGVALATAFGLRKTGLILLFGFGVTTFLIPSGYTLYASPLIAIISLAGLAYTFFFRPIAVPNHED